MFHVYCGCDLSRIFIITLSLRCTFRLLHDLLFVYFVTYQKYCDNNNNNNNNNVNASFKIIIIIIIIIIIVISAYLDRRIFSDTRLYSLFS